jgi:hypothetical protein
LGCQLFEHFANCSRIILVKTCEQLLDVLVIPINSEGTELDAETRYLIDAEVGYG